MYYRVNKTYANASFVPKQDQPLPNPQNVSNVKSRGWGDTLAKVFKATGIEKIVKTVTKGKDCGCKKRQETLNKLLPYKES